MKKEESNYNNTTAWNTECNSQL